MKWVTESGSQGGRGGDRWTNIRWYNIVFSVVVCTQTWTQRSVWRHSVPVITQRTFTINTVAPQIPVTRRWWGRGGRGGWVITDTSTITHDCSHWLHCLHIIMIIDWELTYLSVFKKFYKKIFLLSVFKESFKKINKSRSVFVWVRLETGITLWSLL